MLSDDLGLIGNIVECKDVQHGGLMDQTARLIGNIVECKDRRPDRSDGQEIRLIGNIVECKDYICLNQP